MINKASLKTCLGISMLMAGLAQAATITVGPGANYDFDTIQAGIDAAVDGDAVLVAPSEYVITEPVTFRGKAIKVVSEAGLDETTIRMGPPSDPERGSVVIFENNETVASVLEGFTITGARKGSWFPSESGWGGGGISFYASSGTVKNCAIVQNSTENGGGVMIYSAPSVTIANCIIKENAAVVSTGGVFCMLNSFATMTDCIVTGNIAETNTCGGVKCWQNSSLDLTNCIISGNSTFSYGGGAECWGNSKLSLMNCTITGNSAGSEGGGVFCGQGSVTVTNSIIWGNEAPRGPEISAWGGARYSLEYSNIAGGQAEVEVQSGSTINWDVGNIDANPLFAEPGYCADINDPNIIVQSDDPNVVWIDGDYHLKSELGRWEPYSESWVMDDVTSPCIDRGDPNSPLGDEPGPNGGIINMGAYGGTPEAGMSIGQLPPLPPPIPLAHWKLDETEGGIASDSVNDNDGTVYGEPAWQPEGGMVDGALELDGIDDYVNTPFVLNPADGPFSIFVWVKGGAPGHVVISQRGGANWLCTDSLEGNLMTALSHPAGGRIRPQPLVSEFVITDGNWHRIGLMWDGSYRTLYVDDVIVAEDEQTNLEGSNNGLYIGAGTAMEPGSFWSGLIDDVRIYNKALSTEEIEALAQ